MMLDGLAFFQVHPNLTFEDEEELIFLIVGVEVEFTFDNPEPDHGVVHLGQSLIEPGVGTARHDGRDVDDRGVAILVVEIDCVSGGGAFMFACSSACWVLFLERPPAPTRKPYPTPWQIQRFGKCAHEDNRCKLRASEEV